MNRYTATPHLFSICHPAIRSGVEKTGQCCVCIRGTLSAQACCEGATSPAHPESGKGQGGKKVPSSTALRVDGRQAEIPARYPPNPRTRCISIPCSMCWLWGEEFGSAVGEREERIPFIVGSFLVATPDLIIAQHKGKEGVDTPMQSRAPSADAISLIIIFSFWNLVSRSRQWYRFQKGQSAAADKGPKWPQRGARRAHPVSLLEFLPLLLTV